MAIADLFVAEQDVPLHVGYEKPPVVSIVENEVLDAGGNVVQIEHSPEHQLLFLRNSGSVIRVVDLTTNLIVDTRFAEVNFTDMSLSPDGRYLFAADYAGENIGYGTPLGTHYVHRYDSGTRTWEKLAAPKIAWKIEAVAGNRVLLQERDQHVDMTLNSFNVESNTISELSRTRADYYGDFEYDPKTGRAFHGSAGSSSSEIHVRRVVGDSLVYAGSTGVYGSANSGGGSSVLASDASHFYYGRLQVEAADVSNNLRTYPNAIIAASSSAAFDTEGEYYDSLSGRRLGQFSFESGAIHVSANDRDLWVFNELTDDIHHFQIHVELRGVLRNDVPDADRLLYVSGNTLPTNGTLEITKQGQFVYKPDAGFKGRDSFSYTITGGAGEQSTATVAIDVLSAEQGNRAPVASDLKYHIDQDTVLAITETPEDVNPGIRLLASFPASGEVAQIEYAANHDLVFLRNNGSRVEIVDTRNLHVIETRSPRGVFYDMDLTPDGNFLFVSDYGAVGSTHEERSLDHYIHRYDLVNRTWTMAQSPNVAGSIEAVSENRLIQQETNQNVDMMLNAYSAETGTITELSRVRADYYGDIEYDHRTKRVYHGSSSSKILAYHIVDDSLRLMSDTGPYGSVQSGGGTTRLSADGTSLYYGRLQVETLDGMNNLRSLRQSIYAGSNQLAFGADEIYDAASGARLFELDFDTTVHFVSDDSRHWWTFNSDSDTLMHYALDGKRVGLLSHAFDLDGHPLSVEIVDQPTHGSLGELAADGMIAYTPNSRFSGSDRFTYRVFDGLDYSETKTVDIEIHSTNLVDQRPVALADQYSVMNGKTLAVEGPNGFEPTLELGRNYTVDKSVLQLEVSQTYGVLATRTGEAVMLYNLASGDRIGKFDATNRFADFDFTPDGRYLFVADYAGEATGYGTPLSAHYVHRYDVVSGQWVSKESPKIAWKIEAVASDRILLQEHDQHVDMTLNDFGTYMASPMTELSRVRADYYGDMEYDHRTKRVYHGSSGSSSSEIHVRRIVDDRLIAISDTGVYGSAQSGGGGSVLSSDGRHFYYGRLQVEALDVKNNLHTFPEKILAANAEFAVGASAIYDIEGRLLRNHTEAITSAFVSDDGSHLWLVRNNQIQELIVSHEVAGVLTNDSDADREPLTARLETPPENGSVKFNSDGSFAYIPNTGFVGTDRFSYVAIAAEMASVPTTVEIIVFNNWHNKSLPNDVNGDGKVSALDALMIINELNRRSLFGLVDSRGIDSLLEEANTTLAYLDVNGDGFCSANDALSIIYRLNTPPTSESEFFANYGVDDDEEWQLKRLLTQTHWTHATTLK